MVSVRFLAPAQVLVVCCVASGCVATSLPPAERDTNSEYEAVRPTWTPSIWVDGQGYSAHAESLADALEATQLFQVVHRGTARPDAPIDFVAVIDQHPYSSDAFIPVISLLTLGIVPTVHDGDRIGFRFRLDRVDGGMLGVVDSSWTATTVFGWAAAPVGLGENWTFGDPRMARRCVELLTDRLAPLMDAP